MLAHDIRHALRSLRKTPGFALVATLLLGLAIGVGTTTYATLDALLHPYTPIRDPHRVFWLASWGDGTLGSVTAWDRYVRVRDEGRFYESIAFSTGVYTSVQAGTRIEQFVRGAYVSRGYFDVLGVKPQAGRLFSTGPGIAEDAAAVISADVWQRLFSRGPLTDATLTMAGRTYRVVGVIADGAGCEVCLPLPETAVVRGGVQPYLRLRAGVTREDAMRELDGIAERLTADFGTGLREFTFRLHDLDPDPLKLRPVHLALGAAGILVLLIACGNLASLMLARGITRRRDLAVQLALGASRRALVRQLVVESAVVAALGGLAGVVLAVWGVQLLQHQLPPEIRGFLQLRVPHLSWRVFAFALGATGATVLLVGLFPALRVSSAAVIEPLKDGSGNTTGRTRRDFHVLVAAEVALALVLLMGGVLLIRAADRIARYDFGYDPHGLLTAGVFLDADTPQDSLARVYDELLQRASRVEGVVSVAGFAGLDGGVVISDLGGGPAGGGRVFRRSIPLISPGFLATLGIRIVAGRDFADGDRATDAVTIVDETAARRLWPGTPAVGRQLKIGRYDEEAPWLTVIGVAGDARLAFQSDPYLEPEPGIFVVQGSDVPRRWRLVVRVRGDEAAAALTLRRALESALGGNRVLVFRWRRQFDELVAAHEFIAAVFVLLGIFALGLVAVGLYGVLAYVTSQRMREFGVRVALGANTSDLFRLVLRDGAVMVLAGTAIGAFVAMASSPILDTWLYGVPHTDAVSLVAAEFVLVGVSLAAGLGPALRAARADPLEILRAT